MPLFDGEKELIWEFGRQEAISDEDIDNFEPETNRNKTALAATYVRRDIISLCSGLQVLPRPVPWQKRVLYYLVLLVFFHLQQTLTSIKRRDS